ncbi:MAG: DUF983 domain-containing protein, partial [Limisphaerales bacterium]
MTTSAPTAGWRRVCAHCASRARRGACPACGEDLHHQRADDGPSYLTILLVG